MADLEQILFSSTATKPEFQILLLGKPSKSSLDELELVQSKLQLIELERTAK